MSCWKLRDVLAQHATHVLLSSSVATELEYLLYDVGGGGEVKTGGKGGV